MPKEKFFKLKEEKQRAIMQAAYDEFLQSPYSEASINRIIKSAAISRGSFYLYFAGKDDIYRYLLQQKIAVPFHEQLEKAMQRQSLNVFDFTVQCFVVLAQLAKEDNAFFSQILLNSTSCQLEELFAMELENRSLFDRYHVKTESLRFKASQEQQMIQSTLCTLLYQYVKLFCLGEQSYEEVRSLLLKHLLTFKIGWQR